MKNKGFTLVELLAVISILAIIGLIGTTAVTKIVKDNKQKAYDIQVSSIVDSAKMWGMDNVGMLPDEDESSLITLSMLELGHYVDKDITNPLTGELLSKDTSVCVMNNAGSYNYSYSPNGTCTGNMNNKYFTNDRCFAFDTTTGTVTGYYNYEDNSEANAACPREVIMPPKIRGIQVNKIGDNSFKYSTITSIYLPSKISAIGIQAFLGSRLISIAMPSELLTIGSQAFAWSHLNSIVIPEMVTSIGSFAFEGAKAKSLLILTKNVNISGGAFVDNMFPDDQAFIYPIKDGKKDYTYLTCYGGANREHVIVPEGIKTIGPSAMSMNGIKKVDFPSSLTTLSYSCFRTNNITELNLPDGVTTIPNECFIGNNLKKLVIPKNITVIGGWAFGGSNVEEIVFNSKLISISGSAFGNNNLTKIAIPNSVREIYGNAFAGNSAITDISIDNVKDSIENAPWGAPDTAIVTWLR